MLGLFPDRVGQRRKIGIRKCANRDAKVIGPQVEMPIHRTAAGGAEMKADLSPVLGVARVDFFKTHDCELVLFEVDARMLDGTGAPLAGLAVTDIHDRRFSCRSSAK